jgi:nitrate reductase gamma subunit
MTGLVTIVLYLAAFVLLAGLAHKIRRYWRVPAPLKIPTTPAPTTAAGVVLRMFREVAFFESLFRSNRWIWLFSWMFHAALVLVLLRHLRYFMEPTWTWVVWVQPFGKYAAFAMVLGLAGLWLRRVTVPRVRYISSPSDHLMLVLLIGIALSGLALQYLARTDIIALKAFTLGLVRFDWQTLPGGPVLLAHLAGVAVLMIVLPFSKLLHIPGIFFSPTRNQIDNPREKRHAPAGTIGAARQTGGGD